MPIPLRGPHSAGLRIGLNSERRDRQVEHGNRGLNAPTTVAKLKRGDSGPPLPCEPTQLWAFLLAHQTLSSPRHSRPARRSSQTLKVQVRPKQDGGWALASVGDVINYSRGERQESPRNSSFSRFSPMKTSSQDDSQRVSFTCATHDPPMKTKLTDIPGKPASCRSVPSLSGRMMLERQAQHQ